MSIKKTVYAALSLVLPNSHAIELPDRPTWPAIVFDIDTTPESGWTLGGGYEQHIVNVVTLARTLGELESLRPQIAAAFESMPGFMGDEERGDAEYEGDANVYAYFQNFRVRTLKQ